MKLILTDQVKKYYINPDGIYSPSQIENLKLLPSKKSGYAAVETVNKYIRERKLRALTLNEAIDGRVFKAVKGTDLIEHIKKYHPDFKLKITND